MTYPTISHFIESFTGIFIPLPIQTFGVFIVLAFIFGRLYIYKELSRKEKLNIFNINSIKTKPTNSFITDYIINGIMNFLFGYKIFFIINNYQKFAEAPQEILLSKDGDLIIGLAFLILNIIYTYYTNKKTNKNINATHMTASSLSWQLLFIAAISGIIGAKFFSVFENFNYLLQDPLSAIFSFSGLTFYGGLICGTICVIIYAKRCQLSIPHLADTFAPSLLLGYGVGRLGCHFSGDGDWGIIANMSNKPFFIPEWLWGYNFPHNVIEKGELIEGCIGKYCNQLSYAVHPTSLYEAIFGILAFIMLWKIKEKITTPGILFLIYLTINGIERFLIESIRVTEKYLVFSFEMTQAQIIAIFITLIGSLGIIILKKRTNESI